MFIPTGLTGVDPLLVAEGPTDTAALLDFGFDVIGRPCCNAGTKLVIAAVKMQRPRQVVVVADHDGPGQKGAKLLRSALLPYCLSVKIITPPADIKDARAWKQSGVTYQVIQSAIERVIPDRLIIKISNKNQSRKGKV